MPINVGNYTFKNKSTAKQFVRELRDKYGDGELVSELDSAFLSVLIEQHPEAVDKIGQGITHFSVATDTEYGKTRHFVLHRIDGTSTDFSFIACIDGRNTRADTLGALRCAVSPSIIAFRDAAFGQGGLACPFTGTVLHPNRCHIDHTPPDTFLSLVERWLTAESLKLSDVRTTPEKDNQVVATMTDNGQRTSWISFHDEHANLRILSPLANLSHAKKGL